MGSNGSLEPRQEPGRPPALSRRRLVQLAAGTAGALAFADAWDHRSALAAPQPHAGGTLQYGLSTDPPNLDPHVSTGYSADTVKQQVYSGLVRLDEDLKPQPELATSWESPDPQSVVFKLRSGVRWHDGSPFTADDVKFSLERILAPNSTATRKSDLQTIAQIDVVDPATVRIRLKQPDAALLPILASPQCLIVSKKFVDGGGNLDQTMMGTGPFKFGSREPGVELKVEKNAAFWESGHPYLDGISFKPLPDDTARVNALKTGAVEMIEYVPWKDQAVLARNKQFQLYSDKSMTFMWLQVRMDHKPLDDPRVRQALALGVDREAILKTVFFGRGEVMSGGMIPKILGGSDKLDGKYKRDIAKAKQLLAAAGHPNGFEIGLLATSTYGMHKNTAEVVQASLKDIGVTAKLEMVEWATLVTRRNEGSYDLLVNGGAFDYADPTGLAAFLQSSAIWAKAQHYNDPQLDQLFAKSRSTTDPAARAQISEQIDARLLEQLPWIALVRREQAEAAAKAIQGYSHIPGGNLSGVNLRRTWMEQ